MSRGGTVLRSVPHTGLRCPVPGLLVESCWEAPGGQWWSGVLPDGDGVRVLWADGRQVEVAAEHPLRSAANRVSIGHPRRPPRLRGDLPSGPTHGVIERPGTASIAGRLFAYTRSRKRLVLRADGQPELWLRARGATGAAVRTANGRLVATWTGGREIRLHEGATPDQQVLAVLLLTGTERQDILPFGNL